MNRQISRLGVLTCLACLAQFHVASNVRAANGSVAWAMPRDARLASEKKVAQLKPRPAECGKETAASTPCKADARPRAKPV